MLVAACAGCSSESGTPINVIIRLPGPTQALSKAELSVDYSRSGAHPAGDGGPACTVLLPLVDASFRDSGDGKLDISVTARKGFSPPVDLVACRMVAAGGASSPAQVQRSLRIDVRSAVAIGGDAVSEKRLNAISAQTWARSTVTARQDKHERDPRRPTAPARAAGNRSVPARAEDPGVLADGSGHHAGSLRAKQEVRRKGRKPFDSGPALRGILDRVEESRVESPQDTSQSSARRGGSAPTAAPGLPTILSSVPTPNDGSATGSGSAGSGSAGSGPKVSGGTVGEPDPSTSTPTREYQITVSVLSSSGDLGALQIDLNFVGASGAFLGRGASVDCTSLTPGALVAFNRINQVVKAGFITMNGIATPAPIFTCKLRSRENVTTQSFRVQVVDASATDGKALDPPPFVGVSDASLVN